MEGLQEYVILSTIKEGGFGNVYKARRSKDNSLVAVKYQDEKSVHFRQKILEIEVECGKLVKHENLVTFLDYHKVGESHFIILEYIEGMDLVTFLEKRNFLPLSEYESRGLFRQLMEAILYLHNLRICQRDIKLDNIMINSQGKIKLLDFGLAKMRVTEKKIVCFLWKCGVLLPSNSKKTSIFSFCWRYIFCWSGIIYINIWSISIW